MDAQRLTFMDEVPEMPDDVRRFMLASSVSDDLREHPRNGHILAKTSGSSIRFYSGPELADLDVSIDWLVDGILVRGQPCLLAGSKKTLKTNISIDLVISLATGTPFLGKYAIPGAARSGLISAESGAATIRETANRIARSKGFNGIRDCPGALFAFETPTIRNGKDCEHIRQIIDDHELELLVIDPSYLTFAIGDDGKNIFRMGELLAPLSRIGQETGCTIILSHHARKGSGGDGEPLGLGEESYSGFSEWARQWLYLSRRVPYDELQPGSHKLWLRFGGSAGHSGLIGLDIEEGSITDPGGRKWELQVLDVGQIKAEKKAAKQANKGEDTTHRVHMEKVRTALESFPEGETQNTIAAAARLSKTACLSALLALEQDGELERCDVMKNKRAHSGWKRVGHWDCPSGTTGQSRSPGQWDNGTTSL